MRKRMSTAITARRLAILAVLGVLGIGAVVGFALAAQPSNPGAQNKPTALAAPTLTSKPADPSATTSATFAWTHPEAGVTFQCTIDGSAWAACSSPKTYAVDERKHDF